MALVTLSEAGMWCESAGVHIDPHRPVERAILTHAHADHAQAGSGTYLASTASLPVLKHRLPDAKVEGLAYGEVRRIGEVNVSLHPSGHVLGSAQVRLERDGEVCVVSGDYKRASDPTCPAFEPLRCNTFITEATFALPVYQWEAPERIAADMFAWWEENRAAGRASVLYCYSFGKAQRILAELMAHTDRPVFVHGATEVMCQIYRDSGVAMLPTQPVVESKRGTSFAGELILAPVSAQNTPWLKRFGNYSSAFASGFMRVRGERRRRSLDRGFALSDHADWPALLQTVKETGAEQVFTMHGHAETLAKHIGGQVLA